MDNTIQVALKKLIEDQATPDEVDLLRQAFASGQIFIGGNVQNSVIIVGSGNSVQLTPEILERLAATRYLSALHQLPQPPADFVGRKQELKKILANIEKKGGTAISGFIGMAGIGKTALGLIVAHNLINKYSDAQFYIDLRGTSNDPVKPVDVMKQIIQSFYPTADLRNASEDELAGAYQSILAEHKTIIFLDNAHDASHIMPLRPPSGSLVLITSRWNFTVPGLHSVKLDVLNKRDAIHFLKEICPRLLLKDAGQIAELCGYLPIALRLAGSYLQIHSDWSPVEYINQLMDKTKRLESLHLEGADASLEASFEQSYQQLSDEEKRCWFTLAIFPMSFKRAALAAICNLDDDLARKLAGKLHQYSLLDYDSVTNRYRLHDLLIDFANTKIAENQKEAALQRYLKYYRDIWFESEDLYTKGGDYITQGLLLFDGEYKHIESAYEWAINNIEKQEAILSILKDIPEFIYLARLRLHPHQQIQWLNTALSAANKLADQYNKNKILGNLGSAYSTLGDYRKSIEYKEQALKIAKDIGDRRHEGFWLGNLGADYYEQGNNSKAIEYYQQALEIARELGDVKNQGRWLGNIGICYDIQGEKEKAIEHYEQALEMARQVGDRQNQSKWLSSMGAAHIGLGDSNKAIQLFESALKIAQDLGDKQEQSACLGNIGILYGNLGENLKAIQYKSQALDIANELGSRMHQSFWLGSIGSTYGNMGDNQAALQNYEKAYEIAVEIGDERQQGVLLSTIGSVYINLGENRKAIPLMERALDTARKTGDRQNECICMGTIGSIFANLGENLKAIELIQQAYELAESSNYRELMCMWLGSIGDAYYNLEDNNTAIRYYREALEIANAIGYKLQQGCWLGSIGKGYIELGEHQLAIEYLKKASEIAHEIGDDTRACIWQYHFGDLYLKMKDAVQAFEHLDRSLTRSRELGLREMQAMNLFGLARLSQQENKRESALKFANDACSIFESTESPKLAEVNQFIESLKE